MFRVFSRKTCLKTFDKYRIRIFKGIFIGYNDYFMLIICMPFFDRQNGLAIVIDKLERELIVLGVLQSAANTSGSMER